MINIIKSQPAPACLSKEKEKANGNYGCGEVLKRLKEDFHNKCYICEEKEISTINIEHFIPHRGDKELKFDWNNLFYACGHCNNIKSAKYSTILNCTDSKTVILDALKFEIESFPKIKPRITALLSDDKVVLTAQLLNEVYNGTTTHKTIESENIKNKLEREVNEFHNILKDYYNDSGLTVDDKNNLKKKLKRMCSAEAPFTAFKYWVIKSNEVLANDFKELIG